MNWIFRVSGQVLHYHIRAEYFTPWLDHCDESFLVRCIMSPPVAMPVSKGVRCRVDRADTVHD